MICVYGDLMLDTYVKCKPIRISSEAPIPICKIIDEIYALGGAANVAANIINGFGIKVKLIGLTGNDIQKVILFDKLSTLGITFDNIIASNYWQTIEKKRFIDELGRHVGLRLDRETYFEIDELNNEILHDLLLQYSTKCKTLVISDYDKGTCTSYHIKNAIADFRMSGGYVIVNGKPNKLFDYQGANLLIYNLAEANDATANIYTDDIIELSYKIYELVNTDNSVTKQLTNVLITCGERGMIFRDYDGFWIQEAIPVKVADVTGAGDTVVATIAAYGKCDKHVLQKAAFNAAEVVSQHGTSLCKRKRII